MQRNEIFLPSHLASDNEGMIELSAEGAVKTEREHRLHWQSDVLLGIVFALSSAGLGALIWQSQTPATSEGLAICAIFGVLVYLLRAATPFAAVTGFLLTGCLYLATVQQPNGRWFHSALLPGLALFILAFAATRFRRGQKEKTGLAESRKGRRASQVAANMGAAAVAAVAPTLLRTGSGNGAMLVAIVAALAEAAADTVSSEIGQAIGGKPRLLTSLKPTATGTDGAITLAGTAAGAIAAVIVVVTGISTLQLNAKQAAIAWLAAIFGLFADSLIGATLERRNWLNNDLVNFVSTSIAALLAFACSR